MWFGAVEAHLVGQTQTTLILNGTEAEEYFGSEYTL